MGLLSRRRLPPADRREPRLAPPHAPERRDAGGFGIGTLGMGEFSGVGTALSARAAENLSAVLACVNAISSALASVPARVYRAADAGRVELPDHPVARLIQHGPNPQQTWPDFIEWTFAQALLNGNSVSVIETNSAGQVTGLRPIPWGYCQVILLPSGRMAYDVTAFVGPWGGSGEARRYLDSEVLHLRDRSDDGWIGRSRLSRAPEVLDAALGIQTYAAAVWRNFAAPSGAITHPGKLNQEARTFLRESINALHAGAANAKRIAVLDEGMSWQPFSISPEDAEVLESRRFTVAELCRLYQVPPQIVQSLESNSFTSAETASKWFAQLSLTPWACKLEAVFGKSLLADEPGVHLEIDLSGLMRGDYAARWSAYAIAVQNNILTPNEIREAEGWNPMPASLGEIVPGAGSDE